MKLLYKLKCIIENNNLVKMLMPSLLGIIICITCLMGTTWAWFTDNVTTSIQIIKAADYSITVDIPGGEKLKDGSYRLSQKTEGEGYQVIVKASGSASTGYFKISGPERFSPIYSTQLVPGRKMTFTFYPSVTGEYNFESAWGTYSGGNTIENGVKIGTPKQSDENIYDTEGLEDTEISNDAADSTPVHKPNGEENPDEELNEDSEEEMNQELDEIPSIVQPTEVPDDTEETLGNTVQNQE